MWVCVISTLQCDLEDEMRISLGKYYSTSVLFLLGNDDRVMTIEK